MKSTTYIIYIFILGILLSCSKNQNLEGNYSFRKNGGYVEVYFKKDSMRIASENYWIKLSEWRKIKVKNDTLYFETFGEWKISSKAKIEYIGNNKIELYILDSKNNLNLELISENINIENSGQFWDGFHNRMNSKKRK